MSKGNTLIIQSKRLAFLRLVSLFKTLVSYFLRPTNDGLGSFYGSLKPGLKKGIDPTKNFLLKRATRLCSLESEGCMYALYKLPSGILVLHSQSSNELVSDKIEKTSVHDAEIRFGIPIRL